MEQSSRAWAPTRRGHSSASPEGSPGPAGGLLGRWAAGPAVWPASWSRRARGTVWPCRGELRRAVVGWGELWRAATRCGELWRSLGAAVSHAAEHAVERVRDEHVVQAEVLQAGGNSVRKESATFLPCRGKILRVPCRGKILRDPCRGKILRVPCEKHDP